MKNHIVNLFKKRRVALDKKHQKYIENMDYFNGVIKEQIAEHRASIEAELAAADYIDEQQLNAALSVYDDYMKKVMVEDVSLKKTNKKKMDAHLAKVKRIFERRILREIHRFGLSVQETKISATFGEAMEDGHVITSEWRDNVRKMLSDDAAKYRLKSYKNNILSYVGHGFFGVGVFFYIMMVVAFIGTIFGSMDVSASSQAELLLVAMLFSFSGLMISLIGLNSKQIRYGDYIDKYIDKMLENYFEEVLSLERKKQEEKMEKWREEFRIALNN